MSAPDLKPCPFCGSAPRLWEHHAGGCEIECVNGHCPSEPHVGMPTAAEAIAAWNTRAPLAEALAVVLEALKDGEVWGSAVNAAMPIINADLDQSAWVTVSETREALEAALRAIGGDA